MPLLQRHPPNASAQRGPQKGHTKHPAATMPLGHLPQLKGAGFRVDGQQPLRELDDSPPKIQVMLYELEDV